MCFSSYLTIITLQCAIIEVECLTITISLFMVYIFLLWQCGTLLECQIFESDYISSLFLFADEGCQLPKLDEVLWYLPRCAKYLYTDRILFKGQPWGIYSWYLTSRVWDPVGMIKLDFNQACSVTFKTSIHKGYSIPILRHLEDPSPFHLINNEPL